MSYATLPADQTYAYTYDDNGNILSATFGDYSYSYVYDSQNQLIRENNSKLGRTYTWEYDNAGNILSRSTYAYTTGELGEATATIQYRYEDADWGDMLTGIASHTLTYDEIGNMLSFGPRTFTWEHGRQLATQTINGVTWTYTYDSNGMRTGRTNGTNTYEYIYNGSQLMRMTRNGVVVDFTYINGIPATLTFNGNTFYYVVNGQGDVTGITDSSGNLQLSYYYDAWGNSSYTVASGAEYASTLLTINPLLYRGYVLDREVGMYYLQSRYYIPEIGRFVNADAYASTGQGLGGDNMFAYCGNNAVNNSDPSGYFFLKAARELLDRWLNGDGSPQAYGEKSSIVKALKKSTKMQLLIGKAIINYKTKGIKTTVDTDEFTAEEDGWNLYLSTQHFSYRIDVKREVRTRRCLFWRYHEDRYVATVCVYDKYDFDPKPWEGIGNTLNNIAWILNVGGVGNDYDWTATYTYKTDWEHFRYAN